MSSTRVIKANGIDLFIREAGHGPLVVLCHGWPELSYSWRHQIPALAAAGFHVVAPDMRGYGQSSAPTDAAAYSIFDTVGDVVGLVQALGETKAIVVGHDWGAPVAWHAALFRPDIFTAVAGLSVPPPFRGRGKPLELLRQGGITNFYWQYFQTLASPRPNSSATWPAPCASCSAAVDLPIRPRRCSCRRARAFSAMPPPRTRCRRG